MTEGLRAGDRMVERPDETTIRYSITGPSEGSTLVLIHGWGCERRYFDDLVAQLPADLRVVAVDLAEHGDSRSSRTVWTMEEFARDVDAVLSAESITRCVVVGHSLGARWPSKSVASCRRRHPRRGSRRLALSRAVSRDGRQ